jgi:hypothetical protein
LRTLITTYLLPELKANRFKILLISLLTTMLYVNAVAQNPLQRLPGAGSFRGGSTGGGDSLRHRTGLEDSITIFYRFLDTTRYRGFDSTISDFTLRFPIPAHYTFLGNLGNAAKSLIFSPVKSAGWDPGFHAFDIYQFKFSDTRFYNTTRPYSELGYVIGSRTEQLIHLIHTQNVTPDWNVAFEYQLINSPGLLKNQNTNHNSYRLNTAYQSRNRRYHAYFIMLNNKLQSAENGGLTSDTAINDLVTYGDRSGLPVNLGNRQGGRGSFFNTEIVTGNKYTNRSYLLRQQYDFGIKDSIVTDTVVIPLFYPKFRLEHNVSFSKYSYNYIDYVASGADPDTVFYTKFYDFPARPQSVYYKDAWRDFTNDFSIYQFPDSKNAQQFIKVGASFQMLKGDFDDSINVTSASLYNIMLHGEYRNKTRNRKWDIEANGQLYPAGFNAGDYNGLVSLKRYISRQVGYLQVGFQNLNRTPSQVFGNLSAFNRYNTNFNKENITNIFGSLDQPVRKLTLTGSYYLISNYTYFTGHNKPRQATALFNLLQVGAEKEFSLSRRLKWYTQLVLQQKTGNAPVNVPLFYSRNRVELASNLGFKNLDLHLGTELRYHTPYKADAYSPVLGQFFYQETVQIALRMPHIDAYLHFRIKSFTAYIRALNLNTASLRNGFGFTNNNYAAPGYIYPGLQLRLGIFWSFIN